MTHPLVSNSVGIDQIFLCDETLGCTGRDSYDLNASLIAPRRSPSLHSYFPRSSSEDRRFIIYLEPSPTSELTKSIKTFYRLSRLKCGPNEAHMYHPHCSMTGFLSLKPHQFPLVISTITKNLNSWLPVYEHFPSPNIASVSANSSRVVLKLDVPPFYHALVSNLVEVVAPFTRLRPKSLNHISLAYLNKHVKTSSEFSKIDIDTLTELAHNTVVLDAPVAWDIVLYEQTYKSKDLFLPHKFREILRRSVYRPPST